MLRSGQRTVFSAASALTISTSRRELFTWVVGILAAGYFLTFRAQSGEHVVEALTQSLVSKSVVHYLGWYAVIWLLVKSGTSRPSTWPDIAFGLAASLLPFLPSDTLLWISTTAVGLYLWLTSRGERKFQAAAIVLLALSFNGLWAPQLFDLFALPLLWADTALVGSALSLTRSGFTWQNTVIATDGHSIVIFGPCSSFHNISLGLLCWVALTKLARPTWVPGDALVALLVCAAVLLLNTARVYLMALGPASYAYWHTDFGAQLFAWATTAAVVAISLWGAFREPRTG